MEITFYYSPMSSAVPVASALEELEVPHKVVTLDLKQLDQKQPDFLKVNAVGRVPALLVDGIPMAEALAIMQWLGDRFGVEKGMWPASDSPERITATTWTAWAYVSFGKAVHQLFNATTEQDPFLTGSLQSKAWADAARAEAQRLLSALDGQLAKTGYVVGDRFSLADLIVSGVVLWGKMMGISLSDHPHVARWADTCMARPSIRKQFVA